MIKKCQNQNDVDRANAYIGNNFKLTPYLYVDLLKYGKGTKNVHTWIDENDNKIEGLYLQYFDCLHFYTSNIQNYDLEILLKIQQENSPKVLMVQGQIGDRLEKYFDNNYSIERNYILDMSLVGKDKCEYKSSLATREDIEPIVDLLLLDEIYTTVFTKEILLSQMLERFDDNFSRYIVIKDENKIVATCSTYGEVNGLALIGSVMVHPDYRRRGLAADVEGFTCKMMADEGRTNIGFVNFLNTPSINLHEKIGCIRIGSLYKFVIN